MEQAHDQCLAMKRGRARDAQIDFSLIDLRADSAILRSPPLAGIHGGHDLPAGNDVAISVHVEAFVLAEHTVDPEADEALVRREGVEVDVTGLGLCSFGDDLVDHLDDDLGIGEPVR